MHSVAQTSESETFTEIFIYPHKQSEIYFILKTLGLIEKTGSPKPLLRPKT